MDEKKTPWWKTALIAIGSFFTALLTFILFGTINRNSRDADERSTEVRDNIDRTEELNTTAREQTTEARELVDELRTDTDTLRQNVEECESIIQRAKQNAKKK